jgi:HEPN domain-containing protein
MPLGLRRTDLQAIANAKLADAELLVANRRYSNAYYLAGYAVEIGLKACIARQFSSEAIPDKNFVNAIFSHKLRDLVSLAGLAKELKDNEAANPAFAANWALVNEWVPDVRYQDIDPYTAQVLVQAVGESNSGVLPWIHTYW